MSFSQVVTLEANELPATPTLSSPTNGGTVSVTTPALDLSTTDPDGDNIAYELQLDSVNTFNSQPGISAAVIAQVWGSGGGGSGNTSTLVGGGGGGGEFAQGNFTASNATGYTVTVGAGGAINNDGNASWFVTSSTILANGGKQGGTAASATAPGGAGGTGGIGATLFDGGAGGTGLNSGGDSGGGGGGSAGTLTVGGTGGNSSGNVGGTAGAAGTLNGGAGGGGAGPTNGVSGAGAVPGGGGGGSDGGGGHVAHAGAAGKVIISAPLGTITSATGGTHTSDAVNDYWTFTSSGTWTPTVAGVPIVDAVSTVSSTGFADIAQVSDPMNQGSLSALWSLFTGGGASTAYTSGRVSLIYPSASTSSTDADIETVSTYNLTGTRISLRVLTVPSAATSADATLHVLAGSSANELNWQYEGGTLFAQKLVAGTHTNVFSIAYSSTAHAFWAIRELNGTAYWEVSPDGITWNVLHKEANPITLTSINIDIAATCFQNETNPGTFAFSNLNVAGTYISGDALSYTVQSGAGLTSGNTYYWRARATDPQGSGLYTPWSSTFSFNISTGTLHTLSLTAGLSYAGAHTKSIAMADTGFHANLTFNGSVSRAIQKFMTANVGYAGAVKRSTSKQLPAASVSFSGGFIKSGGKSLTAAVSFAGAQSRFIGKKLTAGASYAGSLARTTSKSMAAGLSFSGAITRAINKILTSAAVTFTGAISSGKAFSRALTASVGFSGTQSRQPGKKLTASQSFIGSNAKTVNKQMSASTSFSGRVARQIARSFAAALSFDAATPLTPSLVQSATSTNLSGSTITITWPGNTSTGDLIVIAISDAGSNSSVVTGITDSQGNTYAKIDANHGANPDFELWYAAAITGGTTPTITLTRTGSFFWNAIAQEFSGISATPLDVHTFSIGTTGSSISSASVATTHANELVIGWGGPLGQGITVTSAGSGYSNLYQVVPPANSTIALESKVVTSVGNYTASMTLSSSTPGGWLCGIATFAAGTTPNVSLVKQVDKLLNAGVGYAGSLTSIGSGAVSFSAAVGYTGQLVKSTVRPFTASISTTGTITRSLLKNLVGGVSFAGAQSRRIGKGLTANVGYTGSFARRVNKSLAAGLNFAGAFAKAIRKSLTASVGFTGTFSRAIRKAMTAGVSFAGAVQKNISKLMTAHVSFIGAENRQTNKNLTGGVGYAGTETKMLNRSLQSSVGFNNIVPNGTFETGTTWPVSGWLTTQNATVVIDATTSFEGQQSVHITVDGANDNVGIKQPNASFMTVQPLATYLLSLWVKSDTAGQLQIQLADSVGNILQPDAITWNLTANYFVVNTTTGWSQFTLQFTTNGAGLMRIADFKRSGNATQANRNFWVDNISITGLDLFKQVNKNLTASTGFAGTVNKFLTRSLTASVGYSGSFSKSIRKPFAAAVSFAGVVSKTPQKALHASVSTTSNVVKRINKGLSASVTPRGSATKRISRSMTAGVSYSGSFKKTTQRSFTAAIRPIGGFTKRLFQKRFFGRPGYLSSNNEATRMESERNTVRLSSQDPSQTNLPSDDNPARLSGNDDQTRLGGN